MQEQTDVLNERVSFEDIIALFLSELGGARRSSWARNPSEW